MKNYLKHLQQVGDDTLSFNRKLSYIDYNLGKYIDVKNKKLSVLEIGPGLGVVEKYLNDNGINNIDLVDNDENVLSYISNSFNVRNKYKTNNISQIDKKLKKYDVIFMLQVFEHIPRIQYKSVLSTLVKHLANDGKIIIMVPNGGNPLNMLERYHDLQHETAFTEDSLKELSNYCDIENVKSVVEPYRIPPNNMINIIRIILQKILHIIIILMIIINGGVYQTIMTPNITLIITKGKKS